MNDRTDPSALALEDQPAPAAPAGADPFASLAAQAAAIDGSGQVDTAAAASAQLAATAQSTAAELADALRMVRLMARPMISWWEEYDRVWSDQTIEGIATAGAEIMARHGWTMGQAWAALGPYIALVGATLPPALLTLKAVKARQAAEAVRRSAPPSTTPPPPDEAEGVRP